jgi:hypothetical protein
MLNKQSRTADKGWPSSLVVGWGLTTPHRKKRNMLRNVTKGLGIGSTVIRTKSISRCGVREPVVWVNSAADKRLEHKVMIGAGSE